MGTTLTIIDETTAGERSEALTLELLTDRITVRELIRSRVYQEVKDHNSGTGTTFRGFVQPTDTERTLNGYEMRRPRQVDWERQFEAALEAFRRNGFVILVGERQAEDLDEEIVVAPGTQVSFLKLVPLVGG
jgi:hypothetical protein